MSTEAVDLYAVLGIAPDATAEEVHAAYRRAARRAHPDTGEGSAGEMALVNRAWTCLRDPASRAAYDRARHRRGPVGVPPLAPDAPRGPWVEPDEPVPGATRSRPGLAIVVLGLAAILVVALCVALLLGFTQGPGGTG